MRIVVIGGGPGGLYSALLLKKAFPQASMALHERNRADDTFGFGVVFSDQTMANLGSADPPSLARIEESFAHWDAIDIHFKGECIRSVGHGFSGMGRMRLLEILQERCVDLGIEMHFESEIATVSDVGPADLIVVADGLNSLIRGQHANQFQPNVDMRPNRFVWLGSTRKFDAFTFYFKENEHGLWRVHAYQYAPDASTFIVEATDETVANAGLGDADEDAIVAYCEALFAEELEGHPLIKNRSVWRQFPTVRNGCWHHSNMVLLGDAAHTAHFSIGSGTKLAMEDAIALRDALVDSADIATGLASYEENRRPAVESLQRAAQVSLEWFETTERYFEDLDAVQFGFSLLTRSLRVTHDNLALRDPVYVSGVDAWFSEQAHRDFGVPVPADPPPPMFTPYRLRGMELTNRVVVSPMCQYSATDGMPNDWHLVHLGSRAIGGAGLVMTEMTDVSREGRISPGCTGLYLPEHVAGWKRITDFVHDQSDARIGVQIAHAGPKGSTRKLWEGMDQPLEGGNWPIVSASEVPYLAEGSVPTAIDRAGMDAIRADFVASTQRAEEAGFDMVEVHMAHGYLLGAFISPLTNRRTDAYGGDLEGRMRFPLEVFDAVREAWPESRPISIRISATDWAEGGTTGDDAVEIARMLQAHGVDIVDVSTGQTVSHEQPVYGRLFQTPFSERIRLELGLPTMTVGGISSYGDANSILAAGRADLCVIARAHLYDPYWTRHAADELEHALPWPDPYATMNRYTFRFK
jgi:anthraniloyl-CoA monooxygenase